MKGSRTSSRCIRTLVLRGQEEPSLVGWNGIDLSLERERGNTLAKKQEAGPRACTSTPLLYAFFRPSQPKVSFSKDFYH